MTLFDFIGEHAPALGLTGVVALWLFREYTSYKHHADRHTVRQVAYEQHNALNASIFVRLEKLEEQVDRLRESNLELTIANEKLRTRLLIMESAHQDAPIPMWLKSPEGVMLSVNKAYESEFLSPLGLTADDYVGKTDLEVWGENIAQEFADHDLEVATTRELWTGMETVLRPEGRTRQFGIMKYPHCEGQYLIGIAGIAIPEDITRTIINRAGEQTND